MKRSDFPLILIGMHDYVEGATRLQKYGFLLAMRHKELKKLGFYDDWEASDFGPFSKQLASDLDTNVKNGLIGRYKLKNRYDFDVERFSVLGEGKNIVDDFGNLHPSEYDKMLKLTSSYQNKTLSQLLQDVYYLYPNYAVASKIRAEIGRRIYESDSYLSKEYDESKE